MDKSKAELEYRSVDCESAGLALHQINKLLDGDCSSLQLHNVGMISVINPSIPYYY